MEGIENRKSTRVKYNFEIYYPHINNKKEYENYNGDSPVIYTENISDSGICFSTKLNINTDDFISFYIRIGDYPSFKTFGQVKWVKERGESSLVGCQFYTLTAPQIDIIREFIDSQSEA